MKTLRRQWYSISPVEQNVPIHSRKLRHRLERNVRSKRFVILRELPNVTTFRVSTFGRKTAPFPKIANSTPIRNFSNATFHRREGATAKVKRPKIWTCVLRHGPHLSGPLPAIKACLAFRESLLILSRFHGMARALRPPTGQRHVQQSLQIPNNGPHRDRSRTTDAHARRTMNGCSQPAQHTLHFWKPLLLCRFSVTLQSCFSIAARWPLHRCALCLSAPLLQLLWTSSGRRCL